MGLGACGDPPYYDSEAFFANTTRDSVNVRLLELDAPAEVDFPVDCEGVLGHACERLSTSAFVFERMYTVGPGQALPLEYDEGGTGGTGGAGGAWGQPPCGASVVQIVGLPSTCVFWESEGGESSERLASVADPAFRRRSIRLEGTKGLYRLVAGAGLEAGPLLAPPSSEPARLLGFSGRARNGTSIIEAVTELPDGCLAVVHRDTFGLEPAQRATLYLCAPRALFPFSAGSEVTIVIMLELAGAQSLTITETSGLRRLQLLVHAAPESRVPAATLVPRGGGYLTRCGAYVENLGLETTSGVLAPGEMTDTTLNGLRTRVLLGRAERVLVAPSTCEAERASLGPRFDLLTAVNLEMDP